MAKDKVYTQDMGQPPKEPDGGSVGGKYVPEQLGSGIMVDGKPMKPAKKMSSGGSASSRADGVAVKGKTKGTMVMCGGGMMKAKK
jgi:hypothetical protein